MDTERIKYLEWQFKYCTNGELQFIQYAFSSAKYFNWNRKTEHCTAAGWQLFSRLFPGKVEQQRTAPALQDAVGFCQIEDVKRLKNHQNFKFYVA